MNKSIAEDTDTPIDEVRPAKPSDDVDRGRREALDRLGALAAYTAPAALGLLLPGTASACSGWKPRPPCVGPWCKKTSSPSCG